MHKPRWDRYWKKCMQSFTGTMSVPSNVILQLVSIAEYSTPDWKSTVNIVDNLNDGRGYTIGVVGFCTGTGDFLEVLKTLRDIAPTHLLIPFIPIVESIMKSGDTGSVVGLEKLPKVMRKIGKCDKDYLKATWLVIEKMYWLPTLKFCEQYGLKSALARYIVYDTLLNFGTLDGFDGKLKYEDEVTFLTLFLKIKQQIIEKDESLGDTDNNRVDMQRGLLVRKNMDLKKPMTVYCYLEKFRLED